MPRKSVAGVLAGLLAASLCAASAHAADGDLDGSLDGNAGIGNGAVITPVGEGTSEDRGVSIALQNDGKAVVGGYADMGATGVDFIAVRYNKDGTLDSAFGGAIGIGKVATPIAPGSGGDFANGIGIQSDGKIVLGGSASMGTGVGATGRDFAAVRYTKAGVLDTSFGGGDGIVTTAIAPGSGSDASYGMALQPDDKIVLVGTVATGGGATGDDIAVVRYTKAGALDTSFGGGDGIVTTAVAPGTRSDNANSVAIQKDGKIVVVGRSSFSATGSDVVVVRYTTTGELDTSFGGGDGIVTTAVAAGTGWDDANEIAITSNDVIIVVGTTFTSGTDTDILVVRYTSSGELDTTFGGGDGNVSMPVGPGNSYDAANGVAVQSDGKMIVTGSANMGATDTDAVVIRLDQVGSPDPTFSVDGIATLDVADASRKQQAVGVAIQPNGQIIATGSTEALGWDLLLLRYQAVPVLRARGTMTPGAALRQGIPKGAKVTMSIAGPSRKKCAIARGKIMGLSAGICKVTVLMTPKATAQMKKPTTTKRTITISIIPTAFG